MMSAQLLLFAIMMGVGLTAFLAAIRSQLMAPDVRPKRPFDRPPNGRR